MQSPLYGRQSTPPPPSRDELTKRSAEFALRTLRQCNAAWRLWWSPKDWGNEPEPGSDMHARLEATFLDAQRAPGDD